MNTLEETQKEKRTTNADVLCHYSESKVVTDNISMNELRKMLEPQGAVYELAKGLEPQSFESILVEAISKCSSTEEKEPTQIPTETADVKIDQREVHEVVRQPFQEDAQESEIVQHDKLSMASTNVPSQSNLVQVIHKLTNNKYGIWQVFNKYCGTSC